MDKQEYESQIKFETLIAALSTDFITGNDLDSKETIHHWMAEIAVTLDAEVSVLFLRHPNGDLFISDFWRKEDLNEPVLYDPAESFPYLTATVLRGEMVAVSSYNELPEEAEIDKQNLQKMGTSSFIFFPLGTDSHVLGSFLFAYKTKIVSWDKIFIQKLRFIIKIFSSVIKTEQEKKQLEERIQIEKDLAEERERLSVTLKSIGDGVITTDILGNITLLNDIAEKLTGWTLTEAKGRPINQIFNIINEHTGEIQNSPVEKVIKTAAMVTLSNHTLLIDKKGNRIPIADSGAPIKDSDGNILGVVLVFRDVTLEKKRDADILKLKKLESVGILAGGIAHDFNNILTGILGNIELAALSKSYPEEFSRYLNNASKGCHRAASLTQKLLTFSKGGAPVKENASIGEIVKESIEFILHGSNIKAEWSIPEKLWTTEVDKHQINQVIQNLILNSMESMPDGGVISASCDNITFKENHPRHGSYIMVKIKDTGTGISKDNIDKIFDPYFTTKETGSGLGLAVTHSIVHKHAGFIDVHSEHGKGTIFSIHLPVTGNQKPGRNLRKETLVNSEKHSYSILVMDDEEMIRNILEIMLNKLGHTVITVTNGRQAIEKYKKLNIDLAILDITIPGGMGGIETMKQLKLINPKIKTIISSGYANSPVMSDYKSYGFSESLTKPYLMTELKTTIERVFGV
ncbi:MAG: response regulator [Spirochaetales bacterium]|nr:response regulator [Spirochaetales bacterium]